MRKNCDFILAKLNLLTRSANGCRNQAKLILDRAQLNSMQDRREIIFSLNSVPAGLITTLLRLVKCSPRSLKDCQVRFMKGLSYNHSCPAVRFQRLITIESALRFAIPFLRKQRMTNNYHAFRCTIKARLCRQFEWMMSELTLIYTSIRFLEIEVFHYHFVMAINV